MKTVVMLLRETLAAWNEDKAPRLAAALAYYTLSSLAPLLLIAIAIAGAVYGQSAARGDIVRQVQGIMGAEGAKAVDAMLTNANRPGAGLIATIIGVVTLLLGAAGLFASLKDSLNTIWGGVPRPGGGIVAVIRDKALAVAMVIGVGVLLLASLLLSAGLGLAHNFLGNFMPGSYLLWQALNFAVSFGIVTLVFAAIFKVLPDVEIAWREVWFGAAITSLLFNIGKLALGLYLGSGSVGSTYGAAGSLVVLLLWIYYSAQILFLGAEFTQVHGRHFGRNIISRAEAFKASAARIAAAKAAAQPVPATRKAERSPLGVLVFAGLLLAAISVVLRGPGGRG